MKKALLSDSLSITDLLQDISTAVLGFDFMVVFRVRTHRWEDAFGGGQARSRDTKDMG